MGLNLGDRCGGACFRWRLCFYRPFLISYSNHSVEAGTQQSAVNEAKRPRDMHLPHALQVPRPLHAGHFVYGLVRFVADGLDRKLPHGVRRAVVRRVHDLTALVYGIGKTVKQLPSRIEESIACRSLQATARSLALPLNRGGAKCGVHRVSCQACALPSI